MSATTRKCSWCRAQFVPTPAQLGQEARRKRERKPGNLFCTDDCYEAHRKKRNREFFRTKAGKAYQRARHIARTTTTTGDQS